MLAHRRFEVCGKAFMISLVLVFFLFPMITSAADYMQAETSSVKKLDLFVGKSIILRSIERIKRVSVAAPRNCRLYSHITLRGLPNWKSRRNNQPHLVEGGKSCGDL